MDKKEKLTSFLDSIDLKELKKEKDMFYHLLKEKSNNHSEILRLIDRVLNKMGSDPENKNERTISLDLTLLLPKKIMKYNLDKYIHNFLDSYILKLNQERSNISIKVIELSGHSYEIDDKSRIRLNCIFTVILLPEGYLNYAFNYDKNTDDHSIMQDFENDLLHHFQRVAHFREVSVELNGINNPLRKRLI
jgi:hypothetical protein